MKSSTSLIFITPLFMLITLSSSSSLECNKKDESALIEIKKSFNQGSFPLWGKADTSCCFWKYIQCNNYTGRVNKLIITGHQNLSGALSPAIGNLTNLESITFEDLPKLVGPLPSTFTKLTKLKYVHVNNTGISGSIPCDLSKFTALVELKFDRCKLSGKIPSSLGKLTNLQLISFSGNQLRGEIPSSLFGKLKGPKAYLNLSDNQLTGKIPRSLNKVDFEYINLADNKLRGDASFLFGKTKQATQISLANNKLKFNLTQVKYGEKLEKVDLSHNKIYGGISTQINDAKKLVHYDVSYNQLCGEIPSAKLAQFGVSSFVNNECLCGKPMPPCKRKKGKPTPPCKEGK